MALLFSDSDRALDYIIHPIIQTLLFYVTDGSTMCVYNIRARIVFSSLVFFFGCVWRVFYQHLSSVGMSVLPNTKKREKRALYSTGFPSPTRLAVLFSYIFWNKIKQERKTSVLFDDDWDQQVQLYMKRVNASKSTLQTSSQKMEWFDVV